MRWNLNNKLQWRPESCTLGLVLRKLHEKFDIKLMTSRKPLKTTSTPSLPRLHCNLIKKRTKNIKQRKISQATAHTCVFEQPQKPSKRYL